MRQLFSNQLENWLKHDRNKTIAELDRIFAEKSFAIAFLLLMFLPALPLPTGGITTFFELITMLLCLELIIGRKSIWLPNRLRNQKIPKIMEEKGLPFLLRRVKSVERFSRPRLKRVMQHKLFSHVFGLVVLLFTIGSFIAPPFSGLDTLPAMGVILVSLSVIFGDILIFAGAVVIGTIGITLELTLGLGAIKGFFHFFR